MNILRFIDDLPRHGALNMALDNALAFYTGKQNSLVVLRLYSWIKPTLSCGFHQKVEKRVDFESCQRYGVDVVRRPTGGRELLHNGDLSFSVSSQLRDVDFRVGEIFFNVCHVITQSLKELGIKVLIKSGEKKGRNNRLMPCLASPSQYEILCNGKKIVPMAQRIFQHSVLVHGSIPLSDSKIPVARLLRVSDTEWLQRQIDESSTSLNRILNKDVDIRKLKMHLWQNFQNIYGGTIKNQPFSEGEVTKAKAMARRWECRMLEKAP